MMETLRNCTLDTAFPICYTADRIGNTSEGLVMPGQYDDSMKKLVDANPQDFVSMVLGVGQFLLGLPTELKLVHIYADALLKVIVNEMLMLLHLEFQSDHDERKQQRLHEYNTFASRQYDDLPVCSCVI